MNIDASDNSPGIFESYSVNVASCFDAVVMLCKAININTIVCSYLKNPHRLTKIAQHRDISVVIAYTANVSFVVCRFYITGEYGKLFDPSAIMPL